MIRKVFFLGARTVGLFLVSACGLAQTVWEGNGHAYEVILTGRVSWDQAAAMASSMTFGGVAGHLAAVTSDEENLFIARLLEQLENGGNGFWIGGIQAAGSAPADGWSWITGEPWVHTNWALREPNDAAGGEDRLLIYGTSGPGALGTWNDDRLGEGISGYVVEYSSAAGGAQACVVNQTNGHTYLRVAIPLTFQDARAQAAALGGYLVAINDGAENAFLVQHFTPWVGNRYDWIGLSDELAEGVFLWDSGEPLTYTNWMAGEPNNLGDEDYVEINLNPNGLPLENFGRWNDNRQTNNAIIEIPGVVPCPGAVQNRPPDCSGAFLSASTCWPPNHRFSLVQVLGVVDLDGEPVRITVSGLRQDEPVRSTGRGSGSTCPDGVLVDADDDGNPESAGLRCERDGAGNGRVYSVDFTASDGRGGQCSGSLFFCVPHDREPGGACANEGQDHLSTDCPGAGGAAGLAEARIQSLAEFHALTPEPLFLRGDANWDGELDVSDAIGILWDLFNSAPTLDCPDAADVNDDGEVDISDPISLLAFLYLGNSSPPPPLGLSGSDLTLDSLGCD